MRLWAAGLDNFLVGDVAGDVLQNLADDIFWGPDSQRDLLVSLHRRWPDLALNVRVAIEKRLLAGPPRNSRATVEQYRKWRAYDILNRVTWLHNQGCIFVTKADATIARMRKEVPQWTPEKAFAAADSTESCGGLVVVDTSFDGFEDLPISELIPCTFQQRQRYWGELRELDPYAGLCENRPIRVLAALRCEFNKGADVAPAWSAFLNTGIRRTERVKISAVIARRLISLPSQVLKTFNIPASSWLEAICINLYVCDRDGLLRLFDMLVDTFDTDPTGNEPGASAQPEIQDWAHRSVNSPTSLLANVLCGDPALDQLGPQGLLAQPWLDRAERLLTLSGDQGRACLATFSQRLGWLYRHNEAWTEEHIIKKIKQKTVDRDAILSGFFLNDWVGSEKLYTYLKDIMIDISNSASSQRPDFRHGAQSFGQFFIRGWLTRSSDGSRWLSDNEFSRLLKRSLVDRDLGLPER